MRDNLLVLNGLKVQCAVPVDHSLEFRPGADGAKERVVPVTHGVLHWTAGEGDGPRVHRVLSGRGLSIHFTIDREGVGELVRLAAERGREARPDIKLGICGEHGGDPASIGFCEEVGLDYVSCSPYRVPIARLAAAQAALGKVTAKEG